MKKIRCPECKKTVDVEIKYNVFSIDMNLMILRLYETWGFFNLQPIGFPCWLCSNQTDEGLGCETLHQFEGKTPYQAIYRAYRSIKRRYELKEVRP